jgi:hypothetical protein
LRDAAMPYFIVAAIACQAAIAAAIAFSPPPRFYATLSLSSSFAAFEPHAMLMLIFSPPMPILPLCHYAFHAFFESRRCFHAADTLMIAIR